MHQINIIKELKENFNIIAGPCAVENYEMLDNIAKNIFSLGVKFLRAGAYKPRTSPYDFQGLKKEGLKIIKEISKKYNLITVSEIVDTRHIDLFSEYIDVLQVGSRNMQNFELLKQVGKLRKPVILKRGMCSSINEFKLASEYIACEGNNNIIMCERGIRTFETATRNTLDISCIAILKNEIKFPVIADISHSLGRKDISLQIAKAIKALGADGIMIEVHNDPKNALSDNLQQMNLIEFKNFMGELFK